MHRVGALIGHVPIVGTETPGRFLAVLATLHLARDRPLQALALLQMPLQVAWVLLSMTMLERGAAEEVGKRGVQVAQSFLRRALGHRVHPGHSGLLARVQFPVEINGRWTRAGLAILVLLALQAPVVRPTRRPGMLLTGGDLRVIQIQLGLVGALNGAHAWCASSASSAACSTQRLTHS